MTKRLIPIIACALIFGAAVACTKQETTAQASTATPTNTTPVTSNPTTTAPASTEKALVIPDGTTEITKFYGYDGYTSVTIPGSVKIIPDFAFATNPTGGITANSQLRAQNSSIANVTIGNGVREIGRDAFIGQRLTSVTIPNSVTAIGYSAFADNQLTGHLTIPGSVTSIVDGAFMRNQLTSVTIPDSVTDIIEYAFANNIITGLTLGKNVREIGKGAFDEHLLTESLVIPDNVTTIGNAAFRGNNGNNVTSLIIGNNVREIGEGAFENLNLTSVTIPASVRNIRFNAFNQTNPITRVTFEGDNVKLQTEKDIYDEAYMLWTRQGSGDTPFDGNLHEVYSGRGTYVRGSNGQWTKQ